MKGKNLPTYKQLCENVEKTRNAVNAIEDVTSEEFIFAEHAYKHAKNERDGFAFNMKRITNNGNLLRA